MRAGNGESEIGNRKGARRSVDCLHVHAPRFEPFPIPHARFPVRGAHP